MTAANATSMINVHLGLFKLEWSGYGITVLFSKAYYCFDKTNPSRDKHTAKGVQKFRNPLQKEDYNNVLQLEQPKMVENSGFQSHN